MPNFDNYSFKEIELIVKEIDANKLQDPAVITGKCYQIVKKSIIVITNFQKIGDQRILHYYFHETSALGEKS